MTSSDSIRPARSSVLHEVLSSRLYLGSTVALFLAGVGASAAAPQIVLYLVRDLGASLPVAGSYYLTSLAGPVVGYLIGRHSDRTGNRLNLFRLCALAGFLGWGLMALASQVWLAFLVGATLLAVSTATFSQLFAAVHDEQVSRPSAQGDSVVAVIRMANTAGWVVGPVIGAWVGAMVGLRPMLWMTAACFVAQILVLGRIGLSGKHDAAQAEERPAAKPATLREMVPLLLFTSLFMLVYLGESIKYGFLLIYMEEQLHIDPAVRGAVIGVQPFIELLIMPFSVVLGRRLGMMPLMALGAGFGVAANLCFALWGDATGMFAGQILMGGVWGFFMVLGIIVAQRLLPDGVATASAIFLGSTALASALGGLAGGFGVSSLGLPHVFLIPAGCALVAAIGLAAMARAYDFR